MSGQHDDFLHGATSGTMVRIVEHMTARIQVIDRATALLRILGTTSGPVRLKDLAASSGLSPSTTRRILASLIENDLCEQARDGSYRLGLGMFELGQHAHAAIDLRERSRDVLQELSQRTRLTSFVCIRHGLRATCIERLDGRYAFSLALTVGGALPLHVGGAPRALLAGESDEAIRRYLRDASPLERFTENTITDSEDLLDDIRACRSRGWVVSDEDVTPGVAALAVPVYGHGLVDPVAAISIAGLQPHVLRIPNDDLVTAMRWAGDELSRILGHHRDAGAGSNVRSPREAA